MKTEYTGPQIIDVGATLKAIDERKREEAAQKREHNGTDEGPQRIYLEPLADPDREEGRLWCQDDDPGGTGYPWIKYIRADLVPADQQGEQPAHTDRENPKGIPEPPTDRENVELRARLEGAQRPWVIEGDLTVTSPHFDTPTGCTNPGCVDGQVSEGHHVVIGGEPIEVILPCPDCTPTEKNDG